MRRRFSAGCSNRAFEGDVSLNPMLESRSMARPEQETTRPAHAPLPKFVRKASRPFRRRTRPGTAPGVIRTDPQAPDSQVSVIAYGPEPANYYEAENYDIEGVHHLMSKYPVVWLNVDGLGGRRVIERVGELFGIHALALEDVVNVHQRAKIEDYEDLLFIVARMAWFPSPGTVSPAEKDDAVGSGRVLGEHHAGQMGRTVDTEQVSLFLGSNFVVTFQERPGDDSFTPVRSRLRLGRGRIRDGGADTLAYGLLDAIIDGYFPVIEEMGERLEQLDSDILLDEGTGHLTRLHRLRGDLLALRRHLWPQREAVHVLIREPHPLVSERTHYYLRDIYDHTAQALDVVEAYLELCADLREYHYGQLGARTNQVVKVLTVISTIFIPLTFVVGVYGMNFDTSLPGNMPELRTPYAYPVTMVAMLVISVALLGWFWRQGWLERDDR